MKLLVIDGNSIINRAFYGIRALSNKKGVYTNALTGFFNIFMKLRTNFNPDAVAVAFDLKAPTFRHKMYSEYKGTRKPMPPELAMQMPLAKQILTAMGIKVVELEGYEADDIIGTLAHAAELQGGMAVIATGDRDSFQLITDSVTVNLAANKEDIIYTPAKIAEVYGVAPAQMLEVKALMGDSSDNIPGVTGIGEKTALVLIQKYSTLSNIYENIDKLEITDSVRKKLATSKDNAFLSRELGKICLEVPIDTDISAYAPNSPDNAELAMILNELEMFSLLKKMNISASELNAAKEKAQSLSTNITESKKIYELDKNAIDIIQQDEKMFACCDGKTTELSEAEQREFLENERPKRTFNAKMLWSYCLEKGISPKNIVFDSTLSAYLLNVNASEYTLERLCDQYNIPLAQTQEQLAECLFALNTALFSDLKNSDMDKILEDIELPLAEVLASMEKDGFCIDTVGLKSFGEGLVSEIARTEAEIYELAGESFNINSPKQLGVVLFEHLNLPCPKKTKASYSTNADVLEFLSDKHPIANKISQFRTFSKLYSTYVIGLLKQVGTDGRVHSFFKQTETRTGRISSADPNVQNIPVRTELGRNMRRFFVAKKGCVLVDADYSQIELRVLAHLANDKNMQQAFVDGDDIHAITASQVFNQPLEWVTPEMRSSAKAVNFGIVYGIGAFSLSKDIGVSVAEGKRYIDAYLHNYSGVAEFMDKTVSEAKQNGYVTTMFGRRRYIGEINSSNKTVQAAAGRIAKNTPIQGTAADIIKLAMIRVYNRLKTSGLNARLILQVHDELIVEASKSDAQQVAKLLREEMENCVKLCVPLTADAKIGESWYETH